MSKYVKDLMASSIKQRLEGVDDMLLVNLIGMEANDTVLLRKKLREKDIHLLVVKNSLARRATEGTPLANAFEGLEGSAAVCWGSEDFISLVKEVVDVDKSGEFENFEPKGGVMDGERIAPEKLKEISKWPNRQEQLSILMGQILSPGASLLAQLNAPGGLVLSQIDKKAEAEGDE